VHLAAGDIVLGVAGEKGILQPGDGGMSFEGCGDVKGIGGMPLHSYIECLEASAEDPGIEGRKGGAGTAAEKIDFFDQLLFADDGAARTRPWPSIHLVAECTTRSAPY